MTRQLYKYSEGYRRETLFSSVFVVFEVLFEALIPYVIALLLDKGVQTGDTKAVYKYGLLLVVFSILSLLCGVLSAKSAATASSGFSKNVRSAMYKSLLSFSFSDIDKFSTPEVVTRMTTDTNNLRNTYLMLVRIAFRAPAMFVFSMGMVIAIGGKIAFIYCILIPILAAGVISLMKLTAPIYKRVYKAYDKINLRLQENLRGVRVVKSFVAENKEIEKFESGTKEVYDNYTKAEKLLAFSFPLMQLTVNTSLLIISWVSAHLIVAGEFTAGELTSLISYSMQIFLSARLFISVSSSITQSSQTASRVLEVIDCGERALEALNKEKNTDISNYDLVFDNVSFGYTADRDKYAVADLSFSIKSGETVGVIGPTGCGKTTVAHLMANLYRATEGKITLGGSDITDIKGEILRKNVVVVLQQSILFSGNIKENLVNGLSDVSDAEIKSALLAARAFDFVSELKDGLGHNLSQSGTNLSGGQRQRLCIARALLRKPRFIIFDDSTSAVDAKTESEIRENLESCLPGSTKVFISQRIASVRNCDKIVVLENGRIEAIGTHDELINTSSVYKDIYSTQIGGAV